MLIFALIFSTFWKASLWRLIKNVKREKRKSVFIIYGRTKLEKIFKAFVVDPNLASFIKFYP